MRSLQFALPLIAVLACLTYASSVPAQEQTHHALFDTDANMGGYAGVTLGESDLSIDAGELAHSSSLVTAGHPISFELVGGYRPAPIWSSIYGVGGTTNGRGSLNLRLEWEKLEVADARRADLVTLGAI